MCSPFRGLHSAYQFFACSSPISVVSFPLTNALLPHLPYLTGLTSHFASLFSGGWPTYHQPNDALASAAVLKTATIGVLLGWFLIAICFRAVCSLVYRVWIRLIPSQACSFGLPLCHPSNRQSACSVTEARGKLDSGH